MTAILSPSQCRAARALLDISQADLAEGAGVGAQAVGAFENGTTETKAATLRALRQTLEYAGIEFGPDDGTKRRTDAVLVWTGKDANRRLLEDIYATLKDTGGEILIYSVSEPSADQADDRAFLQWHLDRLQERGITERILIREGDTNLIAPAHWYRQIPEAYFSPVTYQLYGDKLALIAWGEQQRIVLIENRLFAGAFAKQFNFAWDNAARVDSL